MAKVEITMYWQVYGKQEVELPDDIDPNDHDAVEEYIDNHWDEIPLPVDSDYVECSDEWENEYTVVED